MYYPGQVVWDRDRKVPAVIGDDIWDRLSYPRRSIHFEYIDGRRNERGWPEVALPKSIDHARHQLLDGIIRPGKWPTTHCRLCMNWKSNPPNGDCRAPWVHTYLPQSAKP